MKLNRCSEVPHLSSPSGDKCLDTMEREYSFIKRLGKGFYGTTFEVSNEDNRLLAVKVAPLNGTSILDVSVACKINSIKDQTGVFVITYGWLLCHNVPEGWRRFIEIDDEAPNLFIVMELGLGTWADHPTFQLSKDEIDKILFLILHGLYVAHRDFNFWHNDLHDENILLAAGHPHSIIEVTVGDVAFEIKGLRLIPKIIDFGLAEVSAHDASYTDLFNLRLSFSGHPIFKIENYKSIISTPNGLEVLVMHPLFAKFRVQRSRAVESRCVVCSNVATARNKSFKFCGERCFKSIEHVRKYI